MEHRLFVAIPLKSDVVQALTNAIDHYKHNAPFAQARFTPPENLHLTSLFLGSIASEFIPPLAEAFTEALKHQRPLALRFETFTLVPSHQPHMLWARFKANDAYRTLVESLTNAAGAFIEEVPAEKELLPHVTLARFKTPIAQPLSNPFITIPDLTASACVMMESIMIDEKRIYRSLETFPFRG